MVSTLKSTSSQHSQIRLFSIFKISLPASSLFTNSPLLLHSSDDKARGRAHLKLLEAASKAASLAAKRPGQVNHLHPSVVSDVDVKRSLCATKLACTAVRVLHHLVHLLPR